MSCFQNNFKERKKSLKNTAKQVYCLSMKSLKYLFTLLLFFAVVPLFAQQDKADPVSVVDVKFKKIQANEIQCSEGQWTRIEVILLINGNPDENANNQQWVRNIDVGLTLVYKDEKAKDKKSLDNLLVMKSKARLFAGKVNAKVPVVFYVPSEAYFVYRLAQDAFAWSIDLTVNGSPIKLSKNNYKKLLSKEISSSNNVVKVLENYNKLVSKAASANEGVLLPLPDCPFNVQWYEYFKNTNQKIPTYIKDSSK